MNVSAIIVTRGDHDLTPVLDSLPNEWERIVWDNGFHGHPHVDIYRNGDDWRPDGPPGIRDLMVYGRYAAIEYATGDLIYVQDDDCIVEDPAYIVDTFITAPAHAVICNMPPEFRHDFYVHHSLVGFGAAFHRSAPGKAFGKFMKDQGRVRHATSVKISAWEMDDVFLRTCDVVFTALTPRVLVDVPKVDLPYAHDENRMWKQPGHQADRARMLDIVRDL